LKKVDDLFENSRQLLAKEAELNIGTAILVNALFGAIRNIADRYEDPCDKRRLIVVGRCNPRG